MCGISGAIFDHRTPTAVDTVAEIIAYQSPRGPDATGFEVYDVGSHRVALGHNRLSIIDLSDAANQPIFTDDRSVGLVFNGEIYNYRELRSQLIELGRTFRTDSDSEVLLQAYCQWGVDAFDRFLGMFAFALLDVARRKLVLVRDRFGVKPLYYRFDGTSLVFASTPGIIARRAGLSANLEYVARGLQLKYYEDASSISPYVGVDALEPAHYITVAIDGAGLSLRKQRYYDVHAGVAARADGIASRSADDLVGELLALLEDACRLRLRSDVPVGLSLSGGLDSSSIAVIAGALQPGLQGFSYGQADDAESEGPLAARVAHDAGIDVSWIWPRPDADMAGLFRNTLIAQGAPFPHSSMMAQYAVFERARAEGVKVLLGGQGGDEALMGYRKFFLFSLQDAVRNRRIGDLPMILSNALQVLPAIVGRAGVFWAERHRYSGRAGGMETQLRLPDLAQSASPAMSAGQGIRDRQIKDITHFSLPTLLRYEDRNSMANSIESRLPFLDHRLLEFGVALPQKLKLRSGYGKWALRRAMDGKLFDGVRLSRDKRGFDTRQTAWIRGGLGSTVRDMLHEDPSMFADLTISGATIDTAYSDEHLIQDPQALKEAISLIWLADPVRWQPEVPGAIAPRLVEQANLG